MFERTCDLFDLEIFGLSATQGESFNNYVNQVMKIRDLQAQVESKCEHLRQVHEEMHWFIISGGAEETIKDLYQPTIKDLKSDVTKLQKELEILQANSDLERGKYNSKNIYCCQHSSELYLNIDTDI